MTAAPDSDASFVISLPEVGAPLDFVRCFTRAAPLEVDVGCGKGRFLVEHARANPHINMLGIEVMLERTRKVDKRLQRAGVSNARILRAEATYALERLLPPASIDTLYFFFPDPWPKRRHHRRRLISPRFMDIIHGVLKPSGSLHIATDHQDYFAAIIQVFRAEPRFEAISPWIPDESEQTDFEVFFLGQNLSIGRSSFRKR